MQVSNNIFKSWDVVKSGKKHEHKIKLERKIGFEIFADFKISWKYFFRIGGSIKLQSNLCTMATLGTQKMWSLLTGGRCSEVPLCYMENGATK